MFQTKIVEKRHKFEIQNMFSKKNGAVHEITWKKKVERDRPYDNVIRRMRFVHRMTTVGIETHI